LVCLGATADGENKRVEYRRVKAIRYSDPFFNKKLKMTFENLIA
jgi:hypothetical protein